MQFPLIPFLIAVAAIAAAMLLALPPHASGGIPWL